MRRYFREPLVMFFLTLCALIILVYRAAEHYVHIEDVVSANLLMALESVTALTVLTFLNLLFFSMVFLQKRGIINTVIIPVVTLPTACFIQVATATAVRLIASGWPEHVIRL